ncbi:MAG TPA: efflux RND transporter periplasmic adaptor subunit [Steroidobacteraceae bacterium]|jgi:RND family efflux transporter MFP subunit|nr:efflux RND transporter periplasmic adaptor subunit [Steroidobacteraceae bacterium]
MNTSQDFVAAAEPPAVRPASSWPRRILIATALIAVGAALGIGGFTVLSQHPARPAAATQTAVPAPALTVSTAAARRVVWPATLAASGAVAPWQEASIGAQIGGYQLIDVRVNVGDRVRKGQLLAKFDPALLRADEAQLQASSDQAEANLKRAETLGSGGALSAQDLLQARTLAKTAAAQLGSKQLQLRYTEVLAPDDGTISSRTATLGAVASVGQELFRLIRQNRLEWRGELTAQQLAQIRPGQEVTLMLPEGTTATARVRETAPELDSQSRLGMVYADIAPGSRARAGMYADGRIVMRESPALAVPAESVVIRDGRSYVAIVTDVAGVPRVRMQAVTVGRRQGGDTEITQGINPDDQVIVQGAGFLNDGDVVRRSPQAPGP